MSAPLLQAYDLNDELSIGGIAAWGGQCQELEDSADGSDTCRAALPFQPNLSYRPTQADELYLKLGFAIGNGLNDVTPFRLAPWGADLEDDVEDINGRGRDYLLTAWYRHIFEHVADAPLGATIGIIDATDYLNDNAYANDEYRQFMNEALANIPASFLPGYDWGGALEWDRSRLSLRAVLMNVGENADGNDYDFFGVGIGYALASSLGEGNYRLFLSTTSDDFLDPSETSKERLVAVGLSFDQQFGKNVGAFLRATQQANDAAIDYRYDIAGGLDIRGMAWGRPSDNIGLGYVYLDGGNRKIDRTKVAEAYYRLVLGKHFAVTTDLQYMDDKNKDGTNPKGVIVGLRITGEV